MVFPAIYAFALNARLLDSPMVRGTIWGVVLWLIAESVVMPMIDAGLLSSAMAGAVAATG